MKKRMAVLGIMALTLGAVLTGCGGKSSGIDNVSDGDANVTEEQGSMDEEKAESTFSGDYTVEEEWGYTPFWLKYGLRDTEQKDLSSLVLFNCVSDGMPLNDVLHTDAYKYYKASDFYGSVLLESDNIEDIINYDKEHLFSRGEGARIKLYEEKDGNYVEISVYNITDNKLSLAECIENNQFYIGDNSQVSYEDSAKMAFDIPIDGEYSIEYLNQLRDVLGKPNMVYYSMNMLMNTDREGSEETFSETVQKGGGTIIYDILYEMNNGKLFVSISERNYFGRYEISSVAVCYCTSDLYIYLRDNTNSGELVNEEKVYTFE